jgi:hypothetical protein
LESEDVTKAGGKLGDRIAEAAFPERSEEREVLSNLRRCGSSSARKLLARDGRESSMIRFLEEPEVRREATNGTFGDSLHVVRESL